MALVKGPWNVAPRIEHGYFGALLELTEYMLEVIRHERDPSRMIRMLRGMADAPWLQSYAYETARQMVTHLAIDGARSWKQAARESGNGRSIYEALQRELQGGIGGQIGAEIARNAELIRTLPLDVANRVTDYVGRETLAGRRPESIAEDIRKMFPEASRAKASLIARTESAKTSTALTRARAEEVNIPAYVWRTSEDQRVRSSHRHMDGVIVFWDAPPSPEAILHEKHAPPPYHAGQIWNCRCFASPVVDAPRLAWPHKVYAQGQIVTMTLAEFRRIERWKGGEVLVS